MDKIFKDIESLNENKGESLVRHHLLSASVTNSFNIISLHWLSASVTNFINFISLPVTDSDCAAAGAAAASGCSSAGPSDGGAAPPNPPQTDASAGPALSEEREFLEHVGHQVSALLEPLGIAVVIQERGNTGGHAAGTKHKHFALSNKYVYAQWCFPENHHTSVEVMD